MLQEILDVLEVSLAAIRFLLFSSVGALLILNPSAGTASCLATMLFVALLTACISPLSVQICRFSVQMDQFNLPALF